MSRTIKEIRVSSKKAEKLKEHISDWLSTNHFDVKEWSSRGKRLWLRTWFTFPGFLLSPHIGSIVAVRIEPYGCVVFEIILNEEGNDTLVHGEFYAASPIIMLGRVEGELRPSLQIARQEGYELMIRFLESLESISKTLDKTKS